MKYQAKKKRADSLSLVWLNSKIDHIQNSNNPDNITRLNLSDDKVHDIEEEKDMKNEENGKGPVWGTAHCGKEQEQLWGSKEWLKNKSPLTGR